MRIALSLSALFEIPIEIDNIRAGRPKPGLAAQHLAGIKTKKTIKIKKFVFSYFYDLLNKISKILMPFRRGTGKGTMQRESFRWFHRINEN